MPAWALPALVWAVCVGYAALHLRHGWIPYDAGSLGESARRVLGGQLPHRDFDEIYTGGLSYLNALSFRLLGERLIAMRVMLLAVFALWVPAVYSIARRIAPLWIAALVTLLAAAWSIPVYPEAMPSWYNLFFATFGVWALLNHVDDGRRRWLFAAGVAAALSCLVKIVGVYFVAAALLYLVWEDQRRARGRVPGASARAASRRSASIIVTLGIVAFDAALLGLVRRDLAPDIVVQFVLPAAALSALLIRREWRTPAGPWNSRLAGLARLLVPFLAGLLLPLALALIPYAAGHALGALVNGVFVLPARRLQFAHRSPGGAVAFVLLAGAGLLIPRFARTASARGRLEARILLGLAFVAIPVASSALLVYRIAWAPMRVLVPLTVTWAAWHLVRRDARPNAAGDAPDDTGAKGSADARLFVLAATAALCTLVQFPFATPNYFFYVGPLALLVAVALAAPRSAEWRRQTAFCLAAYLAFTVIRIHPASVFDIGLDTHTRAQAAALPLARAGIDVSSDDSAMYAVLVHELRAHSRSAWTYAGPDAPEVYFLSGLENPTRTLFDFFDDPAGRTPRIVRALDERGVTAVAINARGDFSGPIAPDLAAALANRYPNAERVGRFVVRWRGGD